MPQDFESQTISQTIDTNTDVQGLNSELITGSSSSSSSSSSSAAASSRRVGSEDRTAYAEVGSSGEPLIRSEAEMQLNGVGSSSRGENLAENMDEELPHDADLVPIPVSLVESERESAGVEVQGEGGGKDKKAGTRPIK